MSTTKLRMIEFSKTELKTMEEAPKFLVELLKRGIENVIVSDDRGGSGYFVFEWNEL